MSISDDQNLLANDSQDLSFIPQDDSQPTNLLSQDGPHSLPDDKNSLLSSHESMIQDTPIEYDNNDFRMSQDMRTAYDGGGALDIMPNGYGFLRPKITPSAGDIYISQSQVRRFWLRQGDMVLGKVRPPKEGEKFHGLLMIDTINDQKITVEESRLRRSFDSLTSIYPNRMITLETDMETISTRIIDLVSPIGFGQRGMIVSPPKAGKTTVLKQIASGITANYPDAHLMAILIGERPEEVTDMMRTVKGDVIASHFDQSPREQIRTAEVGIERAKRLVESGKDVIILLDSITRLARAYNLVVNSSGKTMSGGIDPAALFPAKKFLGAARNCEEGGSLTIIGTALINTESRLDDLVYEEFKGTGNMEVHLDRRLAEKWIFPAIDLDRSSTRKQELFFGTPEMQKRVVLRRMLSLLSDDERTQVFISKLEKTKTNAEFLESMKG